MKGQRMHFLRGGKPLESRQWDTALGIPDSRPFIFSGVCGGQDGLSLGLSPLVTSGPGNVVLNLGSLSSLLLSGLA